MFFSLTIKDANLIANSSQFIVTPKKLSPELVILSLTVN